MTIATGLCGLLGMTLISVQATALGLASADDRTPPAPAAPSAAKPAEKPTDKPAAKPAEGTATKKDSPAAAAPKAYSEALKGTTLAFDMVPCTPKDGSEAFYVATC